MSLDRLAVRSLRAHPLRATLSALGVALGVAVLSAGMATSAGIDASDPDDRPRSHRPDRPARRRVRRERPVRGDRRDHRRHARCRGRGSDARAADLPHARRAMRAGHGRPAATGHGLRHRSGPRPASCTTSLSSSGVGARRSGWRTTALISERLAAEDGLALGSTDHHEGARRPRLVPRRRHPRRRRPGRWRRSGGRSSSRSQTAQAVFGGTSVTRVDIGLAEDAGSAAVEAALEEPPDRASRTSCRPPADIAATLRASTTDFAVTTALIAAVALFAGAFLIFNTLSMTVAERVREVGLLRAAGASRRQVMRFMFTQALILGVVGSLLGLGARRSSWRRPSCRSWAPSGRSRIERPALALDGVVLATARRHRRHPRRRHRTVPAGPAASSRSKRCARTTTSAPRARARLRWLVVVFGLVARRRRRDPAARGRRRGHRPGPRGLRACCSGATLLIPFLLPAMARIAGVPFALAMRVEERLARSAVVRDRSRTTLTLGRADDRTGDDRRARRRRPARPCGRRRAGSTASSRATSS